MAEGFHDLPSGQIGAADITHQALAHELVECLKGLFDRRDRIEAMDLVKIDVIRAQSVQTGVYRVEDVAAREPDGVGSLPGPAPYLRRNDELRARQSQITNRLPKQALGTTVRIDVCRIDEIDPGIDGLFDKRIDAGLIDVADLLPITIAREGHGPQADLGNVKASIAEDPVFHCLAPFADAVSARRA